MRALVSVPVLTLMAVLAVAGCRVAPVQNIENTAYYAVPDDGRQLTLENYRTAIIRAGGRRGWVFAPRGVGHLEGKNVVRGKHTVIVDVLYNRQSYSVTYKDSINMNYNAARSEIHPNYNSWVRLLSQEIQTEVQNMRAGTL